MCKPEFVKDIEKQRRTTFKVSSIPIEVLSKFKTYCKNECGDIYWVGILQLLQTKERLEKVLTQFDSLQSQIDELKGNKRVRRTFGE